MDADFPAAHSMDTYWFAVDKDGRVACFSSGEAGAVPVQAMAGDDAYQMLQRLAQALPAGEVLHDRQGRARPGQEASMMDHLGGMAGAQFPVLMFLKSLDPVADEIAAGRAVQVPSTNDFAVVFRQLPQPLGQRLHEEEACLGCYFHFEADEAGPAALPSAARRGLYEYRHTCENWISGPYGRTGIPANPVHIDQLPPALRNQVKAMQLDVNFAETPYLQPMQHTECASWEAHWLDLEGKQHTMPGREGHEDENLEDFLQGLAEGEGEPPDQE
jgi:hypothetical protein